MIICQSVTNPDILEEIFYLRTRVFVEEQGVSPDEEFDDYEATSTHWAASLEDQVIACARHRQTEKGYKIERMAVEQEFRGQGVGRQLLLQILETLLPEIAKLQESAGDGHTLDIYLHAQVQAMPFYLGLGFAQVGELFYEANIPHYRCIYQSLVEEVS